MENTPLPVQLEFLEFETYRRAQQTQHVGGIQIRRRTRQNAAVTLYSRNKHGSQRVVAALQVIGGALLLINRFVPLGLVLLGPVIVNILLYHLFLNPAGILMAIVVTILWFIVFYWHRQYFSGIFVQRTT